MGHASQGPAHRVSRNAFANVRFSVTVSAIAFTRSRAPRPASGTRGTWPSAVNLWKAFADAMKAAYRTPERVLDECEGRVHSFV
jgi:hypothetical protein